MIVVSDTSPLAYLVEIGIADFLPILYGEIYVPTSVASELRHSSCPASLWMNSPPEWLQVATPQNLPVELDLDRGELEAISLALELGARQLLIDERKGRAAAEALGLRVAGTLAVILDCAKEGLCDGEAALDGLAQTTFYASPELLNAVRDKLSSLNQ